LILTSFLDVPPDARPLPTARRRKAEGVESIS
jgi:predicted ester cyclase